MKSLGPLVTPCDQRVAKAPPKVADAFYSSTDWRALRQAALKRDRFRCVMCGKAAVVVDHIVSRRAGGGDDLGNLRCLCRACDNRVKEGPSGERRGGGG
jgi:5-methylcytosine-specific restriction endonuclease McrA